MRVASWIAPSTQTQIPRHSSRSRFPPLVGLLIGVPFGVLALLAPNALLRLQLLIAWLLIDLFAALFFWGGKRSLRPEGTNELPGFEDGTNSHRVDLDIRYGRAILGADRGRLWVDRDALCFAGERTSFALTKDLIDFKRLRLRERRGAKDSRSCKIPFVVPGGGNRWSIQVDFVAQAPGRRGPGWLTELQRLERSSGPCEIRQLPPIDDGPGADSDPGSCIRLRSINALTRTVCLIAVIVELSWAVTCQGNSIEVAGVLWMLIMAACIVSSLVYLDAILGLWSPFPFRELYRCVAIMRDVKEAARLRSWLRDFQAGD